MNRKTKSSFEEKYATKKNVFDIVSDATEKILEGMQSMFDEQNSANDKKFATKDDLKREIGAVRSEMATKDDLKREIGAVRSEMATKDDLKREIGAVRSEMATKDDLKRGIGFVRSDIQDLRAEISTTPTRKEFEGLKRKVDRLSN